MEYEEAPDGKMRLARVAIEIRAPEDFPTNVSFRSDKNGRTLAVKIVLLNPPKVAITATVAL